MNDRTAECSICFEREYATSARSLPIYINGSEGIIVCSICQNAITDYVRTLRSVAGRARKQGWVAGRGSGTVSGGGEPGG